jgi:hypothetical protein
VIARCLEKDPADRFRTAVELRAALVDARREGLLARSPESAPTLALPVTGPPTRPPPAPAPAAGEVTARFVSTPMPEPGFAASAPAAAPVSAPSLAAPVAPPAFATPRRNAALLLGIAAVVLSGILLAIGARTFLGAHDAREGSGAAGAGASVTPTAGAVVLPDTSGGGVDEATPATGATAASPLPTGAAPPAAVARPAPRKPHHVAGPRPTAKAAPGPASPPLGPPDER